MVQWAIPRFYSRNGPTRWGSQNTYSKLLIFSLTGKSVHVNHIRENMHALPRDGYDAILTPYRSCTIILSFIIHAVVSSVLQLAVRWELLGEIPHSH
jgi:hypothetical protein